MNAKIGSNVKIGADVEIGTSATIEADSIIGDRSRVSGDRPLNPDYS